MADRLAQTRTLAVCTALTGLLLSSFVSAQTGLPDPTRPPAGVVGDQPVGEVSGPVLQSVIIPKKGKPVAIIGGQQVVLGGLYGESRLIKLSEREAVLEGPGGIEHLTLTPGIEKTTSVMKKPAARDTQNRGKP